MDEFTKKVNEFHAAFGLVRQIGGVGPCIPPLDVSLLRIQCLVEEVGELAHGLAKKDKAEVLDALVDIQYFLSGTIVACGMGQIFQEAFEIIHQNNMSKLGPDGKPIYDSSGRVCKPEGFKPPDLGPLLRVWG